MSDFEYSDYESDSDDSINGFYSVKKLQITDKKDNKLVDVDVEGEEIDEIVSDEEEEEDENDVEAEEEEIYDGGAIDKYDSDYDDIINDNEDDDDDDSEKEENKTNNKMKNNKTLENKKGGKKGQVKIIEENYDEDIVEEEDDEEEYENENYLQKFDDDINKSYIMEFHPECFNHNYDEITAFSKVTRDSYNIIVDPLHKTLPFLTKYEKAKVLGQRSKQIETGAKPLIKLNENIIDSHIIAELELEQKIIPFIIRRPIPGGGSEYWNLKDLELINF